MAPRSIWNGTISFGLVKVPIKLYSATESHTIRFREVHLKDAAPLEHRRICSADDRQVEYSEIVKGYEIDEDEYVVLTPCPPLPSMRLSRKCSVQPTFGCWIIRR